MLMNIKRILSTIVATIVIAGCAGTPGVEMLGEPRARIAKESIRIFDTKPQGAEAIARVRANFSYGVRETDEEKLNYAKDRVISQAARLGANVVVIDEIDYRSTSSGAVLSGVFEGQTNAAIESQPTPVVQATLYYLAQQP